MCVCVFSVYDVSSASVREDECIGSVLVRLDDIVHSSRELLYELLHENPAKAARIKGAIIILTYENKQKNNKNNQQPQQQQQRLQQDQDDDEDSDIEEEDLAGPAPMASAAPKATLRTPARGASVGGLLGSPGDSSSSDEDASPMKRPTAAGRPAARASPLSDSGDDFTMSLGSPSSLTSNPKTNTKAR